MWNAFMNGSGLHGGGGAGGGYVPSQGWEFVPCSRMDRADRGRVKNRNPLKRISSPPTVFSQLHEPQLGVSAGREAGSGTQLESPGAQMWPDPESQQEQQRTQHMKLKKELEDLKKRHLQEKEGWMHEKESLLREMADIQGGENRRILLDLKTVLEEVQLEVKREEEKRSELQLQYTRDRWAWEVEKAELKCRIAQLEAREGAGFIGVQSAAARGSVVSQIALGQTSSLLREREEQRRLLTDAHAAAMDLRCRLEHNERDWSREKAELLERFDMERREWESQLKNMQKKIEELCYEVRAKREGTGLDAGGRDEDDDARRLSVHSTCTDSSLLSDTRCSDQLSSGSRSEPVRQSLLAGFDNELSQSELVDALGSGGTWPKLSVSEDADSSEPGGVFPEAPSRPAPNTGGSKNSQENVRVGPQDSPVWSEWSYGSDKTKTTTALNAAMKEIARVSEELCSYQDEIRKKSGDKRTQSASLSLPEENKMLFCHAKIPLQVDEAPCDLSQIYNDLQALEKENWITPSPDDTWQASRARKNHPKAHLADLDREARTTPGLISEVDTAAPPIPPRVSSRNQNTSTHPDAELHIGESPRMTVRKCHSPCVLMDRACSSPSIVRRFGAMLQENEGKVLIDGVVASCPAPANSKCNVGCCHNRWSCDASKFSNKLSTLETVQKSFSEVNILTASKNSDCCPAARELKDLPLLPAVKELPADLLLSSLERPPASSKHLGSKRNITLEQKTAEFNRTLFQAEMGTAADASPVGSQSDEVSPPRESALRSHSTDGATGTMDVQPEVMLSFSTSDSIIHEVQPRRTRCDPEGQEVRINMSFEQPPAELTAPTSTASVSPARHSEVKHKVQTTDSSSRKTTVAAVFSELAQNGVVSSSKNGNPCEVKSQSAQDDLSLQQQLSTEKNQRQMTQPGHKPQLKHVPVPRSLSDFSRPVPRIMNDHPWKPLTLAAYPRPEGSRSNYGALEKILKNYEDAAWAEQNMNQQDKASTSPYQTVADVDTLDVERRPSPPALTVTHAQLGSNRPPCVREMHQPVQANRASSVSSSSIQKSFSRPACPANRRLPSRWASHSPASSSTSSSASVVPPALPHQKHISSFTYSRAFHIETVII